jgi:hypothetical protein
MPRRPDARLPQRAVESWREGMRNSEVVLGRLLSCVISALRKEPCTASGADVSLTRHLACAAHPKRQGQVPQSQLHQNVAMIAARASFDTLSTAKGVKGQSQ